MRLLTKLACRYITESWEIITTNTTATINSPTKLQMIFYRWYVIFTNGLIYWHTNKNTDNIIYDFPISDMLNLPIELLTE